MRLFSSKKIIKNLIIILSVLAILTILFPNSVNAETDTEDGGGILKPVEDFVLFLGDKVMQWLQNTFVSTGNIKVAAGDYEFQYSPAKIFSGDIPAFDINFIKPNTNKTISVLRYDNYMKKLLHDNYNSAKALNNHDNTEFIEAKKQENVLYIQDVIVVSNASGGDTDNNLPNHGSGAIGSAPGQDSSTGNTITGMATAYYWTDETKGKLMMVFSYPTLAGGSNYLGGATGSPIYYSTSVSLDNPELQAAGEIETKYQSTAEVLQSTIATWYNALRKIALVGLLSVLVYVGIRIVLSSASSEKAKYKEMLKDWLVAICLLFTLHYIMSITITVTNEISNIFQTGESDVLLNTLREEIYASKDNLVVLAKVIMYVVLVILTVTFTIQYLKRVIYMAFYTLIAPLITLTYPLDKIKDGQAQAFNMWIKEYIYTALTQVIHLVIYFVLVGSALDLVSEYPLYAIIVLAFMKKADGIVKKMFGLDKAETVGTLGAAAAGGLMMNAINKISAKAGTGGKNAGSSGGKESSPISNVRTTSNDALAALLAGSQTGNSGELPPKPSGNGWKGAGAVAKKYGTRAIKGAMKGTAKGFVGATGSMIGFAAGVSQGDISAALAGAVAGGKAGAGLAGAGINMAKNIPGDIKNAINDLADTWNEGAYGEQYAQSKREVRDFKSSSAYRSLRDTFGDELTDEKVGMMLDAGIKEKGDMEKVLKSDNISDAIGYYTLAKKCPDSIYYDDSKLQMYLEDLGLSQTDAKKMRENMRTYR